MRTTPPHSTSHPTTPHLSMGLQEERAADAVRAPSVCEVPVTLLHYTNLEWSGVEWSGVEWSGLMNKNETLQHHPTPTHLVVLESYPSPHFHNFFQWRGNEELM